MECMEARALKSSFLSEFDMKSTNSQGFPDDFLYLTGFPGVCAGEDFSIDEFFNLPNEENNNNCNNIDGSFLEGEEDEEEEKDASSLSHDPIDDSNSDSTIFSPDLAISVDDVQELELWSHLMDDSVPDATLAYPNPITGFHVVNRVQPEKKLGLRRIPFIPSAVPVKARSKRPRTTGSWSWFLGSPPVSESSSSSSSTLLVHEAEMFFSFGKPPAKKLKKIRSSVAGEASSPPVQRRCSHCQVTKTPQWRAGPMGPKTLCNACGVRFKSGRLFPEYRPACSPTFVSEIHSNSHRKVLEMRRTKEMIESDAGLTKPVSGSN